MERGSRYHTLVERVSLDIIREAESLKGRVGTVVRANVLEFKPFDECFYNAAAAIPRELPEEIAGARRPEGAGAATGKLLQPAARFLAGEIIGVFDRLETLIRSEEWLPALVSPELVEVVGVWRGWFQAQLEGRRARVVGRDDPACWLQFGSLLLSIIPQPVHDPTNSAADSIYRLVTGARPVAGLDEDGFVEPSEEGYLWRFGSDSRTGRFDRLRNVLELAFLVPLQPGQRARLWRRLQDQAYGAPPSMATGDPGVRLTALGGPMIHHGQLEGILYVAARYGRPGRHFHPADNERMKELARDGATRRHQLREQIVRDVLLREAQSSPDATERAPLLVLRHLPKLFSISAAACVDVTTGVGELKTGRLVARSSQPRHGRTMSSWPAPGEPAAAFFDTLREVGERRLPAGAVCLPAGDPDVRRVLKRLAEIGPAKVASAQVRSMCLLPVSTRPAHGGEGLAWVFALLFPHPPTLGKEGSFEKNLANSVTQIQLELESLVDFVATASRVSALGRVLAQAGHALVQPVNHAAGFAELAETAFRRGQDARGLEYLADTRLRLQHLMVMTRAAKQYFADGAAPPECDRIDLAARIHALVRMFTAAEPDQAFRFELAVPPGPHTAVGDAGLFEIVLWQMIDNAVAATRRAAGVPARVAVIEVALAPAAPDPLRCGPQPSADAGPRPAGDWATISVRNPVADEISSSELARIVGHARRGVPNRSRSSGGTGLGLVYCFAMAQKMGARFALRGEFETEPAHICATFSLPLHAVDKEVSHA